MTHRIWFLCPICLNVILAYQKGFVSAKAIAEYWDRDIGGRFPALKIEATDEIQLRPYARASKTKAESARTLDHLDFLALEITDAGESVPRFHIEVKAGPASVDEMRTFQLDVNDYNDIVGTSLHTGLPAYLFHVQLKQDCLLPTQRFIASEIWWTDAFSLREHLKSIKVRRGEDKRAIYFDPSAFQPIDTFLDEIRERRFEGLRGRVLAGGLEPLT